MNRLSLPVTETRATYYVTQITDRFPGCLDIAPSSRAVKRYAVAHQASERRAICGGRMVPIMLVRPARAIRDFLRIVYLPLRDVAPVGYNSIDS